jgi:hypothetical protein
MKKLKLLLCLILLGSVDVFAQKNFYESNFAAYANYYLKEYGVICKMPEKFTNLNRYFVGMKISQESGNYGGVLVGPMLKAKDNDCIVGYPAMPFYVTKKEVVVDTDNEDPTGVWRKKNAELARSTINDDIKSSLGYPTYLPLPPPKDGVRRLGPNLRDTTWIDLNKYVTIIAGKKAKEMFNADSIFLYDLPFEKPYERKYTYCTALFISRKDRATLTFKFFLTPKGKKKEEKYINQLSKQILYDEAFHQIE